MDNLLIGPNAKVALRDANLIDTGLNTTNCTIVYKTNGNYKSWKPGRDLNAITTIEQGVGYIIYAKQEIDVSNYFAAPFPEEFTGFSIVTDNDGILIV